MFKSKAIITLVVIVAIAVFVVAAVSSVMTGGSDGYQRPEAMQDEQNVTEESDAASQNESVTDSPDPVETEPEPAVSDEAASTEQPSDTGVVTETSEQAERVAEREARALESNAADEAVEAMTAAVDSATQAAVDSSEDVRRKADEAILAATEKAKDGREQAEELLEDVSTKAEEAVAANEPQPAQEAVETHTVRAQGLVYSPLVVKIQPGDTVAWRNMSTHDTQSMEGLIPEGAEMWHSPMSEDFTRTFEQEGIYVYKCSPHFGAGMGGAIIVGEPVNLAQIKQFDAKGAAKRLVNKAIEEAENM